MTLATYACSRCRQSLPETSFFKRSDSKRPVTSWCKECRKRDYHDVKKHRPETKHRHKWYQRAYLYGITEEQYDEMLLRQGGTCALCPSTGNPKRGLYVDHCHKTGRVRGLVCNRCNIGLHYIEDEDFVAKARAYL